MAPNIKIIGKSGASGQGLKGTPQRSLRLMSVRGVANYCRVSPQSVRRMIKSGKLKSYRIGRQIRIDEADLIANITAQELTQ